MSVVTVRIVRLTILLALLNRSGIYRVWPYAVLGLVLWSALHAGGVHATLAGVALGLTPWTATNATEAWTALKRERGIELWLESRRLGDFRRWATLSRPGAAEDMTGRDLCFATPLSEKQTNPNF